MQLLLVEDDPTIGGAIKLALTPHGYHVTHLMDGHAALNQVLNAVYDVIVLDLNLPGIDGLEVLRTIRRRGVSTPVLVLTARARVDERIAGLDMGADDYLVKPFELGELEARIRALVRRASGAEDVVKVGDVTLNRTARRVYVMDKPFDLPAREYEVLDLLLSPAGRVVSKATMSSKLSGWEGTLADNALEAFISRLRKKLTPHGLNIKTVRGMGYVIEQNAEPNQP